jgi:hypothetical protein
MREVILFLAMVASGVAVGLASRLLGLDEGATDGLAGAALGLLAGWGDPTPSECGPRPSSLHSASYGTRWAADTWTARHARA